jgi:hypothetical protein
MQKVRKRPGYVFFQGPFTRAIFSFWRMWTSKPVRNVLMRKHALSTFVINPLVHIYQKEKIATKIARVFNCIAISCFW